MANEIVRPVELPPRANPVASEIIASDNGSVVGGVTWTDGVNAGRPLASQGEAEAGSNPTKAMTPLTTKQAVNAQVPGLITSAINGLNLGTASQQPIEAFATAAQGTKADSAVQPARSITAGTGLTGGGDLSTDRTISLSSASIESLGKADTAMQPAQYDPTNKEADAFSSANHEYDNAGSGLEATTAQGALDELASGLSEAFNSANTRFLHSGTGAVLRTVSDKLRDVVDVRDYGAKCDGATDDRAAIQAALAAHPTGVIRFPAGKTINISAAIVISSGAPTLCSDGAYPAVIRTTSLTDDIIRIACGSNILSNIGIKNLRLDATVEKTAGAGIAITSNSGYALYYGKFHDLQMSNKMFAGILCNSGGFYNFFERIVINGVAPNSQGIRFRGSGSGSPWANVYMHDIVVINGRSNSGGSNTIGWLMDSYCEGVYAARVSLESANFNTGLYVGGTQVRHMWLNTIIADNTNGTGITITSASVVRLTDCWTTSTAGNGISISNGYDIEIKGHVSISNALSGIKIDGGSFIRILSGKISGNSRSPTNSAVGVFVAAGVSDWMIRDSMFDKSGAGVKTHYADIFVVSGGSDRYSITGCHLFGGATTPLSDGGSGSNKNVSGNLTG